MRVLTGRAFRTEAVVIAVACVSVVALALVLVRDAMSRTEGTLRSAAQQEVADAAAELKTQYEERARFSEQPLDMAPLAAQDLSLSGLSQAVLRPYKDLRGGFYVPESATVLGLPRDSGAALAKEEIHAIVAAVREKSVTADSGRDLLVASAVSTSDGRFAWALKRLVAIRDQATNRRRWFLAFMVLAAVAGVAGVVSISIRLRHGVDAIKQTLQRLETDLTFRPPSAAGDFGEIHSAISEMADRRIELENSLRRQDRLAALGKVVAGVAHEIRNPLNSIQLQLELLKRKTQKGVASTAEVEAAMKQVERLNGILGQLLSIGKPESGNRSVQEILPLAERSIAMVWERARSRKVEVRVRSNGVTSNVRANVDSLQIEQVLTNLLLNAIEASPEKAEVAVEVVDRDPMIEVQVTDYGGGIPDAIRDHIFDAFFTTRPEGTGLGLSVSREIVAAHGGALEFESSASGTTFTVRLPARKPQ